MRPNKRAPLPVVRPLAGYGEGLGEGPTDQTLTTSSAADGQVAILIVTMPNRRFPTVSGRTRARAKQLRKKTTKAERILWSLLSDRKCGGRKFRRQHPIDPYIVDFYCAEAKLVVEIDGESHEGRQDHDQRRDEYLEGLGLRTVRVTNDDVLENLDGVVEAILRVADTIRGNR